MKHFYLSVIFLVLFTNVKAQDPVELFDPVKFNDWTGSDHVMCSLSPDKIITIYVEGGIWEGKIKVGNITGNNVEFGQAYIIAPDGFSSDPKIIPLSENKFLMAYSASNIGFFLRVGEVVNDTEIVFGNTVTFDPIPSSYYELTSLSNDKAIVVFKEWGSNNGVGGRLLNIDSNLEITVGPPAYPSNKIHGDEFSIQKIDESTVLFVYDSDVGKTRFIRVLDNDQIYFTGNPNIWFEEFQVYSLNAMVLNENKFLITYQQYSNSTGSKGVCVFVTIDENSPNPISYSEKHYFAESSVFQITPLKLSSDEILIAYTHHINDFENFIIRGHINETNIQFSEPVLFNEPGQATDFTPIAHLDGQRFVVQYVNSNEYEGFVRIGEANGVLGDNSIDEVSLSIFPNPAQNILNITSDISFDNIEIYSVQGQLIKQTFNNQIDVSELAPGLYFANVSINGQSITKKFVKS